MCTVYIVEPLLGSEQDDTSAIEFHPTQKKETALSFWKALLLPGVIMVNMKYYK
mgnify:CR=1 FL=1